MTLLCMVVGYMLIDSGKDILGYLVYGYGITLGVFDIFAAILRWRGK